MLRHRGILTRSAITFATIAAVTLAVLMAGAADGYTTHAADRPGLVALTFDDGLNGATTDEIARVLEEHGAHGTFFVVGQTLEPQADLARSLVGRGHLLANHSFTHRRASPTDLSYDEASRAQVAFEQTIGRCPRFFRPPWGVQTPFVNAAVRRSGMRTVMWDVEEADWYASDPARLAERVLADVRPGSIILLHDGKDGAPGADRSVQLAALPIILQGLQERGLLGVTLDTLLGTSGYLKRCR